MFEQAGGKLEWDAKKQRVVAKKGDSEVTLTIGSNKAKVGNKDVMMELAAFLFEGRTMVPVRFFEEGFERAGRVGPANRSPRRRDGELSES
jgi:hypothetical protein